MSLIPELSTYMAACWESAKSKFLQEFGEATYASWFSALKYCEFISGRFVVAAPTRFMRDWVQTHFSHKILEILQQLDTRILAFDLIVDSHIASDNSIPSFERNGVNKDLASSSEETEDTNLQVIGSRLDPRYTFEAFVVGKPNELAYAAAQRVAEANVVTFNPLFLYGGVGLGKTHLMHAIAWHIHKCHPQRRVMYLSAEKFMYLFIKALRYKDTMAFKDQFRSVDVLMIDDFQFISGKDSTQEEFFHTFNALVDQNHQVIISADKSPTDLPGLEERMRSRLGWGLVADIHPITYELGLSILQLKAEQMQKDISLKVLEFIAHKLTSKGTSNGREIEGSLNRVVADSMLRGREITIETTSEVLKDLFRTYDRRVSVDEIQKKVAEHFNIKVADMHSVRRQRTVARPRQIAMSLTKQLTSLSLPEIGKKFGGRDHTTVMHAIKKVEELKESDISLTEDIELLYKMLQS